MSISERTSVQFVRFAKEHLAALLEMEEEAYPDPWTQHMFQQELKNQASYFYVMMLGDQIAGYGGFWLVVDEAHVTKVTVAAPWRGLGLGRALMRFLLDTAASLDAKTVRLEVREDNQVARRLYQHLGFLEVGRRLGYYARTNETAVVMVKEFD